MNPKKFKEKQLKKKAERKAKENPARSPLHDYHELLTKVKTEHPELSHKEAQQKASAIYQQSKSQ